MDEIIYWKSKSFCGRHNIDIDTNAHYSVGKGRAGPSNFQAPGEILKDALL